MPPAPSKCVSDEPSRCQENQKLSKPLLTIAIPTYNRAHLLTQCLGRIIEQVRSSSEEIEIIVCNNASTDSTREVIAQCLNLYPDLQYYENESNLGADYNFEKCFKLARADYVWLFSDDDILLPRAIERVVPLLKTHSLGIISLAVNFYPCGGLIDESLYPYEPLNYKIYTEPRILGYEVNFWLTFITGVIVNKRAASEHEVKNPSYNSFLIQLGWVIPALFSQLPSARVETPLILGRKLEVLDFNLFYVYGTSYPLVLKELTRQKVLPPDAMGMLIDLIITKYFVFYVNNLHKNVTEKQPMLLLAKSFWNRKAFWIHLFPRFVRYVLLRMRSQVVNDRRI